MSLLFKISYGLYVVSSEYGGKANACVVNTLMQQTSVPEKLSVTVNKLNLTHDYIMNSGKMCIAVLNTDTTFKFIQSFGMRSGKSCDKFENVNVIKAKNNIPVPTDNVIGYFELTVTESIDMGTHTQFICTIDAVSETGSGEPLTYSYYHKNIKPKPEIKAENKDTYVCVICGHKEEGNIPEDYICPVCKHGKNFMEKQNMEKQNNNIKGEQKMSKFVCAVCGYVHEGEEAPEKCPICRAPREKFSKMSEDMPWAAEHVIGVAQGVDEEIVKDLRANFNAECMEVGMYLAMSRAAFREGYAEIGMYYEKAGLEEAEHAAKFAELLGEVVTDSTKKNLEMRVEAENGATLGKFMLAKKAKEQDLDAIHDTVHEMAKDEARHGKAFKGLLERYFK